MKRIFFRSVIYLSFLSFMHIASADDSLVYKLEIVNHRFEPSNLEVPADKKFKLIVKNLDPTPEEFESYDLNREKIVAGSSEIIVFLGPLRPGTYNFFGEFNQNTAKGQIVVKAPK